MNDADKLLVRVIELQPELMAEPEPAQYKKAATAPPDDAQAFTRDWAAPGSRAAVFWTASDGETDEIPFREPASLDELLELEYVMGGSEAVDNLLGQVDAACDVALARVYDASGATGGASRRGSIVTPQEQAERNRHPGLADRQAHGMTSRVSTAYRTGSTTPAITRDANTSPRAQLDLMFDADDAVSAAVARLRRRVRDGIVLLERAAHDGIAQMLDGAASVILAETLRYFEFDDNEGARAALTALRAPMAKAASADGARTPREIAALPLMGGAADLQAMLNDLKPTAQALLDARDRLKSEPAFVMTGQGPAGPSRERADAEAAVAAAGQALAIALGARREAFPVVVRLDAQGIVDGARADRDRLGHLVFPILRRAWQANRAVRSAMADWRLPAAKFAADGDWPQDVVVKAAQADPGSTVWSYRKHMERALIRVFPGGSDPARRTAIAILDVIHGVPSIAALLGPMVRDTVLFEVAARADRKIAASAVADRLPRLVPVLNWLFAGWSAVEEIAQFGDDSDRYFCTLDPTDALVDVAPSLARLVLDLGATAAFALI